MLFEKRGEKKTKTGKMRVIEIVMNFKHLRTVKDLSKFITATEKVIIKAVTIEQKYEVINEVIGKFKYLSLSKKDKGIVLKALKVLTGYKRSQLQHVIEQAILGKLERQAYKRVNTYNKYTGHDIRLLEETDELHFRLSAAATHEIVRREYEVFHKKDYENISHISQSHINNLRKSSIYRAQYLHHTQARQVAIGETTKPVTNELPGSIRVDTVHQNDIYIINSVDEVTQWEVVAAVPQISERYLAPVLEIMLAQYPFIIFNFHSDRGSEFINKTVAHLLNKLLIHQTKSRSKHCNDQALVEGKNGAIIRKNFGYTHMNQGIVDQLNGFLTTWFNPYLNYHRPCGYVTETVTDHKGRERKIYGEYAMPYEKLKQIVNEKPDKVILKPDMTFEKMDTFAYEKSDNDFAQDMRNRQYKLFDINNFLNSHQSLESHHQI